MDLNYKEFGEGQAVLIIHGFMGSLDNWQTFAKKLGEDFHVFTIDQRNHGQSAHTDEMNYELMSSDIAEFIEKHNIIDPILLGHSMGGKIAMRYALEFPEKIHSLIVADISPKYYPVHHQDILDALEAVDFDFMTSRKDVQEFLLSQIDELEIVQFLAKNIYWIERDRLAYRFNLPVLNKSIGEISGWEDHNWVCDKPTLFLKGGNSDYIDLNETSIKGQFSNSKIETIKGAGHWLHADKPLEFYKLVCDFVGLS